MFIVLNAGHFKIFISLTLIKYFSCLMSGCILNPLCLLMVEEIKKRKKNINLLEDEFVVHASQCTSKTCLKLVFISAVLILIRDTGEEFFEFAL